MENFVVKSQSLTTQYEYTNDDVVVNGTYSSDKTEAEVQGINGQVYRKPEGEGRGEYVGNFTGTMGADGMEYSLSKMTRRNTNLVWDAIDGIEARVLPAENVEEGGEE
jgi:hypothetical protein